MAQLDENPVHRIRSVEWKARAVRRRLLCIQRHVVERWAEEGKEEEEKRRRRAHPVRSDRLQGTKRKKDDEDCRGNQEVQRKPRLSIDAEGGVYARVLSEWRERQAKRTRSRE